MGVTHSNMAVQHKQSYNLNKNSIPQRQIISNYIGLTIKICGIKHIFWVLIIVLLILGTPLPCPNGKFMNRTGYDYCFDCPAGYYCTNAQEPLLCTKGYYCPGNTTADLSPCPRGTYNPVLG